MRTGKELILATKPFASDDTLKSWWYLLSTAALLILATLGTLWNINLFAKVICSVLMGLLVLRLFVIYHDQQHNSVLPRSKVADFMMKIYGILTLNPSSIWKASHNYHHNHNSKLRSAYIGSFPIMTKAKYKTSTKKQKLYYLFMRHPLTILFGYIFVFLFGMCVRPFVNNPRKHFDCFIALVVHFSLAGALAYFFGWEGLILTLLFPSFLAYAIGAYLFYAQHNFPTVSFTDHAGWTYEKAALESSSFLKTGPIMRWFTANIGYHHIHHLNAKIPFYRLPEAMKKIPELQKPKVTSLHPYEIYRCLRLKVWDVDAQRMTTI